MFSFKSHRHQQEAQQFLLRLINDRNSAAAAKILQDQRGEGRAHLGVGIWVIPWTDDGPDVDGAFTALANDISSRGVGLIATRPIAHEEVLLRLSTDSETRFVRTKIRYCTSLGCGWLLFGMEVVELLEPDTLPTLLSFEPALTA
jgi:hypothetical protein